MMGLPSDPKQRSSAVLRGGQRIRALTVLLLLGVSPAAADDKIENRVAIFSALDKVTATIRKLEVPIGETAEFGALKVTPRVCYSRPPTLQPKTTSFVEVEEIQLDGTQTRIFGGWMFAQSPGLNAVEHPVFDVWLTDCAGPRNAVAQQQMPPPAAAEGVQDGVAPDAYDGYDSYDAYDGQADQPRRRVRR
ncbi:DUF2155 domain-containing protein [Hyphomicrobium sp.]|uniref:DUF2155 domain-containing protein n=1 Tax=Hyphomicrobium sp. TaxID=82 RepID=UPI002BD9E5A5|nr:DUF2155 domain-containing protein [Hyphomicrobium sp.]HRN88334.1 DUF2155 domain-containing protein [Hyphomicrobium sp.]HRQ26610.1 DUF2155 domain-containing protein [Hyphomicrobium sp.]